QHIRCNIPKRISA
nr:Chain C, mimotope peptide [Escherichia coli]4H1L_F Chain F, mimotope peptide [Escherichia coli]